MARISIHQAGHCTCFGALARRSEPWRMTRFPATFGLIQPAEGGPVLFDTGYARHVMAAAQNLPFSLYRRLLRVEQGRDAVEQLQQAGIAPGDVAIIVISHFHPDHIGGLRDFPHARFICSRAAWHGVRSLTGLSALRKGYMAGLIPSDFEQRVSFTEDLPASDDMPGARCLDIGGEHATILPLDGHAPGQIGLLIRRDDGRRVLLAADAVWRSASLGDAVGPHPLAMTIQDDRRAYEATMAMLIAMKRDDPALDIIASHDPGPWP